MAFPSFDLKIEDMEFVNNELLFSSDDMDDILLTIDPTDIQNQFKDIPELENEIHTNAENSIETPNDENQVPTEKIIENDNSAQNSSKTNIEDDSENLRNYVKDNRNVNTTIKTNRETARFKNYLENKGEHREIHHIPPTELNIQLGGFLKDLKKKNGSNYEPDSITSFFR